MAARDFQQLDVWQYAHNLTLALYKATRSFPAEEKFGITSQLRRAALSIGSNIAEGCGRGGENELAQFLKVARGSASELHYQVMLARDLGYFSEREADHFIREAERVGKMLTSYGRQLGTRFETNKPAKKANSQ